MQKTRDTFEVRIRVPEGATVVWERLIDLDRHSSTIPLTRVVPAGEHMRADLRFVGETRLGPLYMADRMLVRRADPPTREHPGRLVVEKFGPVAGTVEATVEQVATGSLVAPMPGSVLSVAVRDGDTVSAGQTLLVMEAMKMQHTLSAPTYGVFSGLGVTPGQQVTAGEVLIVVQAPDLE